MGSRSWIDLLLDLWLMMTEGEGGRILEGLTALVNNISLVSFTGEVGNMMLGIDDNDGGLDTWKHCIN